MTPTQRRLALGGGFAAAALLFVFAWRASLVPATHPDHDHGILNLDAGGRLMVFRRDGSERNLVGRPGKVLIIHFFSPSVPEAAGELSALFATQESLRADRGVDWVLVAKDTDFASLDRWLAEHKLAPPIPESLYVDPKGETTQKLNCKRPLDTMFFNPEGKLASQTRGVANWALETSRIDQARGGATIE
ncbi:MAG: TlpA family protein disulfide reductase [Thermoanaerobaculia bacterium]